MASKKIWGIMAISLLQSPLIARSAESTATPAAPAAVKAFPLLECGVEGHTKMPAIDIQRGVTG